MFLSVLGKVLYDLVTDDFICHILLVFLKLKSSAGPRSKILPVPRMCHDVHILSIVVHFPCLEVLAKLLVILNTQVGIYPL